MSSVFKIYSPEDCDFYYDGELQGHIEGNSDRAFRFEVERKGAYRLKFVNSEYKSELIVKVSIDADEEQEVELDFREVNEPVIRERIIIAIEQDYGDGEQLPDDIISAISNNGVITIPKGVRKIGNSAFRGCNLTSITIPDGVKKIGVCAFSGCRCLTHIAIPDSVTTIWDGAFTGCYGLTAITIPDSIKEIGESMFFGCRSLTAITIPDGAIGIGHSAFCGCRSLIAITIPDGVKKIEACAFTGCRCLTHIVIPDSVKEIGADVFFGCRSLTSVYCEARTPQKLEGGIFYDNSSDLKIYVPKSEDSTILEAYKSAEGWELYADIIEEYDFDNE